MRWDLHVEWGEFGPSLWGMNHPPRAGLRISRVGRLLWQWFVLLMPAVVFFWADHSQSRVKEPRLQLFDYGNALQMRWDSGACRMRIRCPFNMVDTRGQGTIRSAAADTLKTVDSGFQDGDPPETTSEIDESELRRALLHDVNFKIFLYLNFFYCVFFYRNGGSYLIR